MKKFDFTFYRDQVEECKNFIAWMYLTLNGTNKDLKTRPTLSCDPTLALRAIECVEKILEQQDINTESKQKIKLMKEDVTINEIKKAKAELEKTINELIGQFLTKYDVEINDIVLRNINSIERFLDNKKHTYIEIHLFQKI